MVYNTYVRSHETSKRFCFPLCVRKRINARLRQTRRHVLHLNNIFHHRRVVPITMVECAVIKEEADVRDRHHLRLQLHIRFPLVFPFFVFAGRLVAFSELLRDAIYAHDRSKPACALTLYNNFGGLIQAKVLQGVLNRGVQVATTFEVHVLGCRRGIVFAFVFVHHHRPWVFTEAREGRTIAIGEKDEVTRSVSVAVHAYGIIMHDDVGG